MRVLFVNVVDRTKPIQLREYPLAFGYLKSYAEANGVRFDSAYLETGDRSEALSVFEDFKPTVLALTSITENYNRAKEFAAFARGVLPNAKIVIGGVHISAVPSSLSPDMTVGVIGEGEQTFLELLRAWFRPNPEIKGIVYWEGTKLIRTPPREPREVLDSIPHPKRDIFGLEPRATYIFTSRGCPYGCAFCSSSAFWGKVRFHSPEYVAEEILSLAKQGVKEINIFDDCFVLDMDRVRKIKDLVKDCGVKFTVAARTNLVTYEVADVLKSMGVVHVGMGVESNSPAVLKWLRKGNTPENNQKAVDVLKSRGLEISISIIRGVPIETKEDRKLTMDFIDRNDLNYDEYLLMRFPNTAIYQGSWDWDACRVVTFRRPFVKRAFRFARRKALAVIGR